MQTNTTAQTTTTPDGHCPTCGAHIPDPEAAWGVWGARLCSYDCTVRAGALMLAVMEGADK